jgi:hypothetical protein
LRIIAVPMMPMPTMPTRLAITASRSFVADQQTRIAHPRQERVFCCDRSPCTPADDRMPFAAGT